MSQASVAVAGSGPASAILDDGGGPVRTKLTDAFAEELDQLLVGEFQDSEPIEREFCDREAGAGAGDRMPTRRPAQENRFYLHRLQIYGSPVEFAVSLQATDECKPPAIVRLLKRSHVLDPGCQRGPRLYVLVHRSAPLLTRR